MSSLEALLVLARLEHVPRLGWALQGIESPESVAAHSLGVAQVVCALGPRVDPPLDVDRALTLAVLHDAPEALVGDLPKKGAAHFPAGAKREAELAVAREIFAPLPAFVLERYEEYIAGETREARFAKLCDRLQLGLRHLAYERGGRRGLEDFDEVLLGLDCAEFPPAEELRLELIEELSTLRTRGGHA